MIRALVLLFLNLFRLSGHLMRKLVRAVLSPLRKKQRRYVALRIPAGIELAAPPRKIGPLVLGAQGQGGWWRFADAIKTIGEDPDIEGVFFRAEKTAMGLAEVGAVADQIGQLRSQGKRVICHMNQAMLPDYLLATSADTIMMTPPGRLYTFGLRMDMLFLAEAFDRLGIKAQFINLGQFKTASHRFTRKRMSRPQMMMMSQVLEGLAGSIAHRIADRRQLEPGQARVIFDEAPLSARAARRHQLIDKALYADDIRDSIKDETECDRPVVVWNQSQYMAQTSRPFEWRPVKRRKAQVAVMSLSGIIMMGDEGIQGRVRNVLSPKGMIAMLKRLKEDKQVKAVVLHIDSPGGSALASDLMWRQIRQVAEVKPVIASLGNVAASGGYYIACAAHQIVAMPETITGSIGVIAGKLSGGALLEKLGVRMDNISVGETSGFTSLTTAMNTTELNNLRRDIRAFYRRFLHRVSIGRHIHRRKLHRLARGRIYTGPRAKKLGLVDEVGDLEMAIDIACKEASITRDDIDVVFADHRQLGLQTMLSRATKKESGDPLTGMAPPVTTVKEQVLSDLIPEGAHPYIAVAMLMREPGALALWPFLQSPESA